MSFGSNLLSPEYPLNNLLFFSFRFICCKFYAILGGAWCLSQWNLQTAGLHPSSKFTGKINMLYFFQTTNIFCLSLLSVSLHTLSPLRTRPTTPLPPTPSPVLKIDHIVTIIWIWNTVKPLAVWVKNSWVIKIHPTKSKPWNCITNYIGFKFE